MIWIHLPFSIVVGLCAVFLTAKRRARLVFEPFEPTICCRIFHTRMKPWMLPGPRHRGSLLPYGRYLLAPLTGNLEESILAMVLRVRPTPTRFPTNILFTPLRFFIKCMQTMDSLLFGHSAKSPIAKKEPLATSS